MFAALFIIAALFIVALFAMALPAIDRDRDCDAHAPVVNTFTPVEPGGFGASLVRRHQAEQAEDAARHARLARERDHFARHGFNNAWTIN